MDKNYWKEAYKDSWDISSQKEKLIKELIEDLTGYKVHEVGLGAGSIELIDGSAKDNNLEKGDADLYVDECDTYVEVTGPNVITLFDAPLWVRPDKLKNAYRKLKKNKGKHHIIVHVQIVKGSLIRLIRGIVLNAEFFDRVKGKEFEIKEKIINGRTERYVVIPYKDKCIQPIEDIIKIIS